MVVSARPIRLVSALTMESPVTTEYRMAPNAAAAIVPIAYSVIELYNWLPADRPLLCRRLDVV